MELQPFPTDWDSALVVAAHPDDIEYGTAAAVAAWTAAGKRVTYLLVTRGEAGIDTMHPEEAAPVREQEERDGALEVGVDVVDFLEGFHDGTLEPGLELRRALAREIRRRRPEVVVAGTFDVRFAGGALNQADHRVVGLEVLDAVAAAGNQAMAPGCSRMASIRAGVVPGLTRKAAPVAAAASSCSGPISVPSPTTASGTSVRSALAPASAASVRRVVMHVMSCQRRERALR